MDNISSGIFGFLISFCLCVIGYCAIIYGKEEMETYWYKKYKKEQDLRYKIQDELSRCENDNILKWIENKFEK